MATKTATQAAAAHAVQKQVNNGPPQVGSPKDGKEQETKPAGWREWFLRFGAVGNSKFYKHFDATVSRTQLTPSLL